MIINCYLTNSILKQLLVTGQQTVSKIDKLLGGFYTIIFKGTTLNPPFTLEFCNIKDGDCIIAVKNHNKEQIEKWLKISQTDGPLMRRLTNRNAVRIEKNNIMRKDLRLRKMDVNPRFYRKMVSNFLGSSGQKVVVHKQETVFPKTSEFICNEALPKFWKTNNE